MAFAIISVIELIYDSSIKGSFLKKIKTRGWFLIIIALLSVVFNVYKDWKADIKQNISENAKLKSDSLLRIKQTEILLLQNSTKDTIIKKVDSTYVKSIKASNEALAKYNLKVTDSLHSVISKLKLDASNPQILIAPLEKGKHPAFLVKENNKDLLKIQFISKGGTCYRIKIDCFFLMEIAPGNFTIINAYPILFGESFLTEDVLRTTNIEITSNILTLPEVIVFLTGSFSKEPQGKSSVPFSDAFKYNFKDKIYISGTELKYDVIKKQLNIN